MKQRKLTPRALRSALSLVFLMLALLAQSCDGIFFTCGPHEERWICTHDSAVYRDDTYEMADRKICVAPGDDAQLLCHPGRAVRNISQLSVPDLTRTNLDGLVDFGQSRLKVDIKADGDSFAVNMKGRASLDGGVCPQPPCSFQVVHVELEPTKDPIVTTKGKRVTGLVARNANIWTGSRSSDTSISMNGGSRMVLEASLDGDPGASVLDVDAWFRGAIHYHAGRLTDQGPVTNNRIDIEGHFADDELEVSLSLAIWATNCQPVLEADASCVANIEPTSPGFLRLEANARLLGSLTSSRDLCEAMTLADPAQACRAGGSEEFPTFTCDKSLLPETTDPAEIAEILEFRWRDANGAAVSEKSSDFLTAVPVFPLTLTVRNPVLGKVASATLGDAPVCRRDVDLAPGACAWEPLRETESHRAGDAWCPAGAFLTALDLDAPDGLSGLDSPIVGHARCCKPRQPANADWGTCTWEPVGMASHQRVGSWCPDGAFLTALDLDANSDLSEADSPIVGQAQCCTWGADTHPPQAGSCAWVAVGRRSHRRGANWCPSDSYLVALDLDGDASLSGHDSPVVGGAFCCMAVN